MRRVQSITWVRTAEEGPWATARKSGVKAAGLAYERKFGKFLQREIDRGKLVGELNSAQWLHWCGSWLELREGVSCLRSGKAYAQPDHYIIQEKCILLFECKLTQTDEAEVQLVALYEPLLEHLYKKPVLKIQVCKNIRHAIGPLEINNLVELLAYPRSAPHTWNWIG